MSKEFRITTRRGHYRVEGREKFPQGSWREWLPEASSSFAGTDAHVLAMTRKVELERREEPWEVVE